MTQITKAYIRTYTDSAQTLAYVEWQDGARTVGDPAGQHMQELLKRAKREGLPILKEVW